MAENEQRPTTPMGDFPELPGIDPKMIQDYIKGIPDPDQFEQLPDADRRKLKETSYVPSISLGLMALSLADQKAMDAYYWRGIVTGNAVNEVRREFGEDSVLREKFLAEIGFIDDQRGEKIMQIFSEVTGTPMEESAWEKYKEDFKKKGGFVVLDDLGPDDTFRAYMWPFIGVEGSRPWEKPKTGMEEELKERFKAEGIEPWRVRTMKLAPSASEHNTLCVFLAK